ncbi:ABC transporter permease [Kitasatospora sp. NPDC050543]|uniref:ABC transporter permease n=1 Tax=Kitasatospora sp. NPDC050543 TaxID=3364054 RepID=UPI00379669AF
MTTAGAWSTPGAGARTPDTGVIHDIGYRGYTGPRLGRGYATRSLFVQSLRAAFGLGRSGKSKVLPMLGLAAVGLPALVIVAFAILQGSTELPLDYPTYPSSFGLVIEIFLAAQAPVLMSRDLRHNTVPLYFSRPITRGDYVRAKFAAMTAAMLLLMVTPLVVLYLGAVLGGMSFGHNTVHLLYGLAASLLYALVLSAIGLLVAASTPRRGFGVATIMGLLVVSNVIALIIYGLSGGLDVGSSTDAGNWAALLSPGLLVDGLVTEVFGLRHNSGTMHAPGALGIVVFAAEAALLVAGSYWLLNRRYRNI